MAIVERSAGAVDILFRGTHRYVPRSPWGPLSALVITFLACIISLAAFFAGLVIALALGASETDLARSADALASLSTPSGILATLASQLLSLAVIWVAAGRAGMRTEVLRLGEPGPGLWTCVAGGLMVLAVTGLLELGLYVGFGYDPMSDTTWLVEGLRSPLWWGTAVVAVILAPIWEELAFRGFLLSALAQSALGFWPAALIVNTLWTLLHWLYSLPGLASVFAAGLVLSWLMRRTGSIRAVIAAHAMANLVALAYTYVFAPAV